MTIDEDDLERAGTRSRRQLSTSKQYSIYPPPSGTEKEESDHYQHTTKKSLTSIAIHKKSRSFMFVTVTAIVLFILYLSKTSLSRLNSTPTKKASTFNPDQDSSHFPDATQLTDYALLNRLLIEKTASSTNRINSLDFTTVPGKRSFVDQLSKGITLGHTFDELRRLTNNIPLPSISSTKKQQPHRRVPVTAIIHTTTVTQLYTQVQSVLTQTALPEHIWILCDTNQKAEVEARIMTLDRRRVKVIVRGENATQQPYDRLQTTSYVSTEFVWIIDQDVAPGKRYLENLLKLAHTTQYKSTLLGTEAASLSKNRDQIECRPDTMHSGSMQMKSQVVDMINDNWLLHRSWIPYILEAVEKETTVATEEVGPFVGLFISRSLYINAGIPSIVLPTDPIERAYWGDVRLQKTQKSETCKALENLIQEGEGKEEMSIYQDLFYKKSTAVTTAKPILVYVDSTEDLISLSDLICKFELNQEADLHLVTGGYMNDQQQLKSLLGNLCKKKFDLDIVIHDISLMLQNNEKDWNSVNHLLHRLTRILTVVQPKVLIHSVDIENALYTTIKAASEMVDVTLIHLPTRDIPHALWMTELPIDTLSKWNSFSIKLMITTDKKPHALVRLLNSATNAHYLGDHVDLTILMDHTTDAVTQSLANNFHWKNGGNKNVKHRIAQTNKAPIFVESWYPASNDEYAIILNNDVELSRYYYIWAKYTILKYRYTVDASPIDNNNSTDINNSKLFGISLYAPRLIETDPSGRHFFNPSQVVAKARGGSAEEEKIYEPYMMQFPSYSGAVFFPEHWREFHDYITARLADSNGYEMQDVVVPDLRSNDWSKSWRRYFEELVYLRSYVMLYPNFVGGTSLSTQHLELRKKTMREQFADAISIYNVPLMDEVDQISQELQLPEYKDLVVLDIWGKISNFEELKERGSELHDEVSACPEPILEVEKEYQFDATDLLCPFARIVSVTLLDPNAPLPELPVREVTVYN